ncbi:LacI family transcriptional regulator [Nonomuraea turkmeniaca]|uniref:LacI family transcriptional regulator n=1 Tax=Nonomuraea turkmeniaca TaxID=103838 RepID=A0A5S4FSY0_9ACTN|nr:LacI family transcriptional regulator [Nonomuraea turkmeniaca]
MTENPSRQSSQGEGPPSVTIAFIAESAGVSIPTVSKVLNGRSGVSEQTRARIENLINEHGYRRPSGNRSGTVELVFRKMEDMWAVEIIRGVERAARKSRIGVMVSELGPHDSSPAASIDDTVGRRSNCVLFVSQILATEREKLKAKDIPFVVVDPIDELPDDVPFVGTTNWRGGHSATRHLLDLGHRRIAMINGPDHPFCRARMAGYFSALAEADVTADPELMVRTALTRQHGYSAALELLSRADRPTAIFASNDMQAFGVYQAARELGLSIPGDLSVVGFDDLVVSDWVDPPLTTVHQPLFEMSVAATELALTLGRGEPVPQLGLEIATTLTLRDSTAPPRS